jgi:hypothetical protein
MKQRIMLVLILILIGAGCQPAPTAEPFPTEIAFPTMTPGQVIRAALPPAAAIPLDGSFSNPSTAAALSSRPTPTPNLHACPAPNDTISLPFPPPTTTNGIADALAAFMSAGGTTVALDRDLRGVWNALGGTGSVRADVDMSGEGTPDVIISLTTPDNGGTVIVLSCTDSRYVPLYVTSIGGGAPQIIRVEDINADGRTDVFYSSTDCASGDCLIRSQIIGWSAERGRFVNLLGGALDTIEPPRFEDIDQDRVLEVIEELTDDGNAETGPLRTGYSVYDWNGATYVRSVTQLNPPRFRIQIIHQADAAFDQQLMGEAISLYTLALDNTTLEPWTIDEIPVLDSYVLYRLLLAYSFADDQRRVEVLNTIQTNYADPANAPIYATLAFTFWNAFQITNNLNSACREVQSIIAGRPEALNLINRYGSRSPTYSALDLCPF